MGALIERKEKKSEREMKKLEEELCKEIEDEMREKFKKRKKRLNIPEDCCKLHPPLPLGSKHFRINLKRPEDEGYFPIDDKGAYAAVEKDEKRKVEGKVR